MFVDIHAHAYKKPQPYVDGKKWFGTPKQILKRYDDLEIERGVLLPLIGPEVYLPQSNEEILEFAEQSDGRFIPFCNVDPRAITNSPEAPLAGILQYYKDLGCKGIGEVMANLPFRNPLVHNLFRCAEEVGLPLVFDISDRIDGDYGLFDHVVLHQAEEDPLATLAVDAKGKSAAVWAAIKQDLR